jgi:hypothetical protein
METLAIKEHEELKQQVDSIRVGEGFTTELDVDIDGDKIEVGFETKNSYVCIEYDPAGESLYFSTASDPIIPTLNETYHDDIDDALSAIKWAIETYG